MNILAIETSCDETALSIIHTDTFDSPQPNFRVLADSVISQIDIHVPYGGVFPALAKREHAKNLVPLLDHILGESGISFSPLMTSSSSWDQELESMLTREPVLYESLRNFLSTHGRPHLDMLMVTSGPGLAPALWVGVNFARALSFITGAPIIPVNHMEGHVTSILLKEDYLNQEKALAPLDTFSFPMISLLISGGHTQLVLVKDWGNYEIIGETVDDAVGEAFDKVARLLGMEYPGGPKVSRAAQNGLPDERIQLPRPMIHSGDYKFSFSGLKTAVRYLVEDLKQENNGILDEQTIANIAREFEDAVTEVLIKKTQQAIVEYNAKGLIIAGGVSANTYITDSFQIVAGNYDIPLYLPLKKLSGDNSLMIASAGIINYWKGAQTVSWHELVVESNLKIGS